MAASKSNAPRWQRVVEEALEKDKKANVYQLATVDSTDHSPRVRSLVHRAFLTFSNPSTPLLLTSTDARTPKVAQLAHDARVELAWWLPAPTEAQLRIGGVVRVFPAPDFTLDDADASRLRSEAARAVEGHVGALRAAFEETTFPGAPEGFDWEEERRARFDAMSGHMRASWARPVPGTRLLVGEGEDPKTWPETLLTLGEARGGAGEENLAQVEKALRNFALVVIDPAEVDYVELGVVPNRRTRFYKDEDGTWKEEALVP